MLNNGVRMPMVGLGTYPLKGRELSDTMRTALGLGYRHFDTAFAYANEGVVGEVANEAAGRRQNCFVTSKLSTQDLYWHLHGHRLLRRKSVTRSYGESCRRLRRERLDLYLLHQPYKGYVGLYREMVRMYEQGKVRAVGVANFKKRHLEDVIKATGIIPAVNQIEVNPYNTRKDLIAYCQSRGIQVVAYSPFGRGLMTKELMGEEVLKGIASAKQKSVAQVILRWLVQQGVAVIPRTNKPEKLAQNIGIFDFELSEYEMSQIGQLNRNLFTGHGNVRVEQDDMSM